MLVFTQMLEAPDERLKIEEIFHTYGNLMFHVANKILNNDHDAEDAVQQAMFAIYQNLEKFSEIKCPQSRSFIVTIVERKAIDLYRAKQRNAVVPFEEEFINVPAPPLWMPRLSGRILRRLWRCCPQGIVNCCS